MKVAIEYTLGKISTSRVKTYTRLIRLSELECDYAVLKKHNCICQTDTSEVVWENFFHKNIYIYLESTRQKCCLKDCSLIQGKIPVS